MRVIIANHPTVVNNYLGILKSLSRENKISLVAGLLNDIAHANIPVENKDTEMNVEDRFFGAFQSDKSTEEMIAEIRGSRNFSRNIDAF